MKESKNKGFSLVEIVVAVAIVAVVCFVGYRFFNVSNNIFTSAKSESDVQNESQMAINQIQDLLIDTSRGMSYIVGNTRCLKDDEAAAAGVDVNNVDKKLYAYSVVDGGAAASTEYQVVELLWVAAEEKLYYKEFVYDSSAGATEPDKKYLLAENVKQLSIDLENLESNKQVEFLLGMQVKGKDYTEEHVVTLRNGIMAYASNDASAGNTPFFSKVDEVVVTPPEKIMQPGTSFTFKAEVKGSNDPIQDVTWKITGARSENTKIDRNGTVTLGADETATEMTVTATSVQDPTKSGTAKVLLQRLEDVSIVENTSLEEKGYIFADVTVHGSNIGEDDYSTDLYFTDEEGNELSPVPVYEAVDKNGLTVTYKIDVSKVGWGETIHIYGEAVMGEWELRSDEYITYTRPYGYVYDRNEQNWTEWVRVGGKPPREEDIPKEKFSEWDKAVSKTIVTDIGTWNFYKYDWGDYRMKVTMESGEVWEFGTLDNGKSWKLYYNGNSYQYYSEGVKLGSYEATPTEGWYQWSDSGHDW